MQEPLGGSTARTSLRPWEIDHSAGHRGVADLRGHETGRCADTRGPSSCRWSAVGAGAVVLLADAPPHAARASVHKPRLALRRPRKRGAARSEEVERITAYLPEPLDLSGCAAMQSTPPRVRRMVRELSDSHPVEALMGMPRQIVWKRKCWMIAEPLWSVLRGAPLPTSTGKAGRRAAFRYPIRHQFTV